MPRSHPPGPADPGRRDSGEPTAGARAERPTRLTVAGWVLAAWTSLLIVYGFSGTGTVEQAGGSVAEFNRVIGQVIGAFGVIGLLLTVAAFAGYRAGLYLLVAWAVIFSLLLILFMLGGLGLLALIPLALTLVPVALMMSATVRAWYPH